MRWVLSILLRASVLIAIVGSSAFGSDLIVTTFAAFNGQTNIVLQATGNIIFAGGAMNLPALPSGASAGQLSVQAGNDIIIQNNTTLTAGQGWSVTFLAGADFGVPGTVSPGLGNITLQGAAALASANGSIGLLAGNGVTLETGFVHTFGGGNISVSAVSGSVNAGTTANGFVFRNNPGTPYVVDPNLGGISTGGGGNVSLAAGQNIVSLLPTGTVATDGGSGAFGAAPGNVTLSAGGNVTGHYVVRNGTGTILAGQNAGMTSALLALSLVSGSWSVTAQDIVLQEVRNPNGVFNDLGPTSAASRHQFDYAPNASVSLNATNSVQLSGALLPRNPGASEQSLPPIFPGTLNVSAGSGGVQIANNLVLFPARYGQVSFTTTDGGSFTGTSPSGSLVQLVMSDSAATQYANAASFGPSDHAATPVHLGDPVPVQLNLSGDMRSVMLVSPKCAHLVIGGNLVDSAFAVQNLSPTDLSSVYALGDILNPSEFTSVAVAVPPNLGLFSCAVDQPSGLTAAEVASLASRLFYDPTGPTLTLRGRLSVQEEVALTSLTVQCPAMRVVQPVDPASAQALFNASQSVPGSPGSGFLIAGPGRLEVQARNLDLGFTTGLQSVGPAQNPVLAALGTSGAAINVSLSGNLNLISTAISSIAGGGVNVNAQGSIQVGSTTVTGSGSTRGIFTTVHADVTLAAAGDIEISGSRIAAYDGGNVSVGSRYGTVDVSLPGDSSLVVVKAFGNPAQSSSWVIPGNGILAATLPDSAELVGNIEVEAGQNIYLGCGAITQFSMNGTPAGAADISIVALADVFIGGGCAAVLAPGNLDMQAAGLIGSLLSAQVNVTNLTAVAGAEVQLSVAAGGLAPFSYQWYHDGATLPSATNSSLTLADVQRVDAGSYSIVVSNLGGTATNYLQLHVLVPQLLSAVLAPDNQTLIVSFDDAGGGLLTVQDIPSFVVQTSTNLVDWTPFNPPLSTNAGGGLWFQFPFSASPGGGFYRVLSQ